MKQVIQNFKSGELYIDEVPVPSIHSGMVLVENKFSLISAGTERGTVKVAQASLLGKARQRPDLVKQVIQNVRKEGLKATLEKVRTKLDSLKALGYSTSGIVYASMDTQNKFAPGTRVACAGADYASHAEMVAVPQNLIAKIPDNVSFEEAAFTTLGAIALQGVRQAEPTLGHHVCVIGLGLLGQLTCQLLRANGCNVFGIDISSRNVELAKQFSAKEACNTQDANLKAAIDTFTHGYGFDSVIITAATSNNDPIVLATEISRKKGRIVVVGAVKMDIPREPFFYQKELELRISCSYGPGRYDTEYEENGQDYPYAYVRWTEQRNMEAFLQLISNGAMNLKPLITHTFEIEDAEKAYDLVMGKVQEPYIGILLSYKENQEKFNSIFKVNAGTKSGGDIQVGFIGAGSFAQSYLIPPLAKEGGIILNSVVTSRGITAKNVADKFKFGNCSTAAQDILGNKDINTVFIATQHDSHAHYTIEALKANKKVFVEKPLALNYDELNQVIDAYNMVENPYLLVGFNRRFSPIAEILKKEFISAEEPLTINYRVNAGYIPKEHWTQNEILGGGRIIGEVCHFIDLMQYLTNSLPVKVFAECLETSNSKIKNSDNILIVIKFANGSIGNLTYVANGDKALAKEYIEIFGAGKTGVIQDFKGGALYKNNSMKNIKVSGKGHSQEVHSFIQNIKSGTPSAISFESICYTTLATFKILDSLATGLPQNIEFN